MFIGILSIVALGATSSLSTTEIIPNLHSDCIYERPDHAQGDAYFDSECTTGYIASTAPVKAKLTAFLPHDNLEQCVTLEALQNQDIAYLKKIIELQSELNELMLNDGSPEEIERLNIEIEQTRSEKDIVFSQYKSLTQYEGGTIQYKFHPQNSRKTVKQYRKENRGSEIKWKTIDHAEEAQLVVVDMSQHYGSSLIHLSLPDAALATHYEDYGWVPIERPVKFNYTYNLGGLCPHIDNASGEYRLTSNFSAFLSGYLDTKYYLLDEVGNADLARSIAPIEAVDYSPN